MLSRVKKQTMTNIFPRETLKAPHHLMGFLVKRTERQRIINKH